LAEKHDALFTSSVAEGPGNDERELPISMVCLIATTVSPTSLSQISLILTLVKPQVHASLDEWSEGFYQKKGDFRSEAYEDVYNGHDMFLQDLKKKKPLYFHRLMADLYQLTACVHLQVCDYISTLYLLTSTEMARKPPSVLMPLLKLRWLSLISTKLMVNHLRSTYPDKICLSSSVHFLLKVYSGPQIPNYISLLSLYFQINVN
jgi:Domain of unknown function (DUF6532)